MSTTPALCHDKWSHKKARLCFLMWLFETQINLNQTTEPLPQPFNFWSMSISWTHRRAVMSGLKEDISLAWKQKQESFQDKNEVMKKCPDFYSLLNNVSAHTAVLQIIWKQESLWARQVFHMTACCWGFQTQTPLKLGVWNQSLRKKNMWEINFPVCLGQNASLYQVMLQRKPTWRLN